MCSAISLDRDVANISIFFKKYLEVGGVILYICICYSSDRENKTTLNTNI